MFPVDVSQFHGALKLAYQAYNIGWNVVHDAHRLHHEFGQDIETLYQNLNNLVSVINLAQKGRLPTSRPSSATTACLNQILGNFEDTLRDCLQLLENNQSYGEQKGPVYNISWYLRVKDEVDQLRDRIAFLNIKLSIVLKSLDNVIQDGLRVFILECTSLILNRIELSETRALGAANLLQPAHRSAGPPGLSIQPAIDDALDVMAKTRFGHLSDISVVQGIDEVVFQLDRATQWHLRRELSADNRVARMARIMTAYWMLQVTRSCEEYRTTFNNGIVTCFDDFELQMMQWGMTTQRFMRQLEEDIKQAHSGLIESGIGTPSTSALEGLLSETRTGWFTQNGQSPQINDDDPRRGEQLLRCGLQDNRTSKDRILEIYQPFGEANGTNLVMITRAAGRPDRVYEIDLHRISINPILEAFDSGADGFTVLMKTDKNVDSSTTFDLPFNKSSDLFKFQGIATGYKVVKNIPSIGVTMRIATLFNGKEKRYSGRGQLWTTSRHDHSSSRIDLLSSSLSQTSLAKRNLSNDSIASKAPILPPLRLSQDSISLSSLTSVSSGASRSSIASIASAPSMPTRRMSKAPSRPASVVTSLSTMTLSEKNPGDLGIVIEDTEPPRLVMLLLSSTGDKSMVVIDIDERLRLNQDRCRCSGKEDTGCVCRRVFLQSTRGDIRAVESVGTVSIAAAGRHQRCEGMVPLKGLTLVVLELPSYEYRASFIRYFGQLQKLRCAQTRQRLGA